MHKIVTVTEIARPAAEVFELVTNAAQWKRWHPATESVSGVPNRALGCGEVVDEQIRVGPRRFTTRWTVKVCEPPRRWVITTDSADGAAQITYRLTVRDDSRCRFERTLEYRSKRLPWRWLDGSLVRWMLARQSQQALDNLRALAEARRS